MLEKLQRLYNTLGTIETKGANTKRMAICLTYLEEIIQEQAESEKKSAETEAVKGEEKHE